MAVGLAGVLEAQIQPQAGRVEGEICDHGWRELGPKSRGVHGLGVPAVLADHESQVVEGATFQVGALERHVRLRRRRRRRIVAYIEFYFVKMVVVFVDVVVNGCGRVAGHALELHASAHGTNELMGAVEHRQLDLVKACRDFQTARVQATQVLITIS